MSHPLRRRDRDPWEQRRRLIDELHFVYVGSGALLIAVLRRRTLGTLHDLLGRHYHAGRRIDERLRAVAFEHGTPPRPCVCEEATALIEEVNHAERSAPRHLRTKTMVDGLVALRSFLLRTWQALIDGSREGQPAFREVAVGLQQEEAALHRELLAVSDRMAA